MNQEKVEENIEPGEERKNKKIFDNPFAHKILRKDEVADIFCVSIRTIERMMTDNSLPHHYIGIKPRFYLDEVVQAFRNDSLDFNRRKNNDQKNNEQGWKLSLSGEVEGKGAPTLQEIRFASGRDSMD